MHFYESSIITTKDGLHCQVYANEHPTHSILVKPKYIPTDKVESSALQYRFIGGKKMNRLDMWAEKNALKIYVEQFKKAYPHYVMQSNMHSGSRLFFSVPIEHIERVYFPRTGLKELMSMPVDALDVHLRNVHEFVMLLTKSGLRMKDFGVTYSTLMGHYMSNISDINIVVYGKENFWKLMEFLENAEHSMLRWKTREEWLEFYGRRNRHKIWDKEKFLKIMERKRSEGFFGNTLFVIFAAEKEEERTCQWGSERYSDEGIAKVTGIVSDEFNSAVRPGFYTIEKSVVLSGKNVPVSQVFFHSRDYCMLARRGEKIEACGTLERVEPKQGEPYYRIVIGYLDSYITERREQEQMKVIS